VLKIKYSRQFKKDYKKIMKQGLDENKLIDVLKLLRNNSPLPPKYNDHSLKGNYKGYRDCHIEPDWLLIYKIENEISLVTLQRTGSHSEIFIKN
jgi:mRNA interferase YafQ